MLNAIKKIFFNVSGQAMTEYVIVSYLVVLGGIAGLSVLGHTDGSDIVIKGGIYTDIYLILRGMIINASLPIP